MKPFEEMEFHPTSEKLVEIICEETGNHNPSVYRVMVAYYLTQVASMMHTKILSRKKDKIPVNLYAVNLAVSGFGKTKSTNIMEMDVTGNFRYIFEENTFPALADINLPKISNNRAIKKQSDPDDELVYTENEFKSLGPFVFSFDSGTSPAVKQARQKLLMANAGSLNLQIDEIGNHLLGQSEVLSTFLELFDMGRVKQKLIKNTSDNARFEEIRGETPTNMLLFGTPAKLLDGSKTQDEFYSMLETGYARRCFFGYAKTLAKKGRKTAEEIYNEATSETKNEFLRKFSDDLESLADISQANRVIEVPKEVDLIFINYRLQCEELADKMGEHDELRRIEISHRYWKAMKLAGAYAFIDRAVEMSEDHAYQAIKMAEESGKAFSQILTRDKPYVRLAKYIAEVKRPVTQADLVEDLPFYKGSYSHKQDMMTLAIAYGYQNNIIIKKSFEEGIEFLRGETLEPTSLNEMQVSYSGDLAYNYRADTARFDELHKMTQVDGIHWCNHAFLERHRTEDNAIPGFNMIVLDVEKSVSLDMARTLLKDYKALFYTTKRHVDHEDERFRIVMPINYNLKLDAKDYKEFMDSIFDWLPFDVDRATGQRSRKWLSHNGEYVYQDGEILDILPFIPKTSRNEDFKQRQLDQAGLNNLERWVMSNTGDGNRNNMLLRYAMILVDAGMTYDEISSRVSDLNDKLPDKLKEEEILATIMTTVGKKLVK